MAANIEQLTLRAQAVEKNLIQLVDSDAASPEQPAALLHEYRAVCENIVAADFEYAITAGIETQLWAAHLKINASYRKQLRHLRRNTKDRVVEIRKVAKNYLQFIKGSQRFYRHYILNLDAQFEGIPELRKIAQTWKDEMPKKPTHKRISASLTHKVLESCHQTLIQLGDLSRYRETELVEKDRNWSPAKGYYDLAAEIYPDSGQSHNQLAVISRQDGNHFRSTYHLYRSLASRKPHPLAKQNLELEFKKIVTAWNKGELINNHKSSDGNNAGRALVSWFIRLHSMCYKGQEFAQHDELESEVLSHLAIELKERPLDNILQKIILMNLAAEYFATMQMQSPDPPQNIMRTYFYYLRLNVKTFFTLLQVLQLELERLSEGDDVTQNGDRPSHLSDKITVVARRTLPGLRLYSTWFIRYWNILNSNIADTLTTVEVQELWKAYAATLTSLASSFPADQLPSENYMLEEDTETIGFQPLVSPETMKLWYNNTDGNTTMKQKWSDLERNHPNVEMLMRVRDFLIDGLTLVENPDTPLDLDGIRFIHREEGLPPQLLVSPNNRPDGSPVPSPVIPSVPMDFPLLPREMPIANEQKAYRVAAASDSASTTLAKDSAMNRMVDDLVGPDDGLDPLPEEDENIPPTPPAQTFEDTALVTDSTYGLASFTISDIVNSVQNYKKPPVSPAPVQAMFATTPMARVASSSSIRQPVNLPSLPDGSYSGNSIWNRNYSGTPGPSSPLLGNGNDVRGSPLIGMRPAGFSGHARGGSSNSLRSADFPISRPLSGGLGSSADWGNPSASSNFGSIYGNGYTGNGYTSNGYIPSHYGSTADISVANPLKWGKSDPWNNGVPSSYGRTPPNGQGG
ncbi:hypothetical protein K504DRAFT_469630 [Pleomassaria siparia CBS 279.74]|uniref:Nonsense-mediated mRNA decay factor n=1 Tax=Pleomassaria siparia CBS 279.74 TaxID=1314801 RepID=A0A6G1KSP5_9PLEO|nr:hypothetical protein K504DRAFT_469630 [Pleomassaria siparia CBS 279.74]